MKTDIKTNNKKIAIVYDWIDKWGGVERILLTLAEIFPNADFFTSYYDKDNANWAKKLNIKSSFIQKFPDSIKKNRILSLPFYPFAFERFDFSGYDLVISVTSSFAKGIITKPGTKHICILLTPTRFLWLYSHLYIPPDYQIFLWNYIKYLKKWDMAAANRPDKIISISKTVQKRVKKIYQRDSEVIYPPFDFNHWMKIKSEIRNPKSEINRENQILNTKYYLVVSRLEPYKKIDIAVNAFNQIPDNNLVIIGKGTKKQYLKSIAKHNITFLQDLSDQQLARYYQHTQALIMPQEEDFGYTALEAQFFGCPVITYKISGAVETVTNHKTGLYFPKQTVESLLQAINLFEKRAAEIKKNTKNNGEKQCQKFDKKIFKDKILSNILNSNH